MKKFKENDKGFTLVELVIVIAIILVLAALLVPRIMSSIDDARRASEVADAKTIASEMSTYGAMLVTKDAEAKLPAGNYSTGKPKIKDIEGIEDIEWADVESEGAATGLEGFLNEYNREASDFPTGKYAYIEVTSEGNVNVVERPTDKDTSQ